MTFSCFKNAILLYVYYMGYVIIWNTLYIAEEELEDYESADSRESSNQYYRAVKPARILQS